jgi:hypothetical protein
MLAAGLAVRPVDLPHHLALSGQEADQPSTVAASPLHAPGIDLAQTPGPGQYRPIALGVVATRVMAKWRPSWSRAQAT